MFFFTSCEGLNGFNCDILGLKDFGESVLIVYSGSYIF